jgi:hypothetical protein
MGTRPLPCTVSFCHSRVAGELICLSVHLSLHFGSPVDTAVDSPVVVGCWKLIRLSVRLSRVSRRLSYRLSWPFTQPGGAEADEHTRKAGHFHAAGKLIRLSVHLSLHFGSQLVASLPQKPLHAHSAKVVWRNPCPKSALPQGFGHCLYATRCDAVSTGSRPVNSE